ncbi:hypothetical protein H5410_032815 [Solanum commersonii]|uniref:DUF4283 domain-containing protein n=1 Tax=Solanum commersonii TaxID=4109 RepID=A0A9J5YNC3_SOLCO|nr:hypothetical protein H5410_032815 [Solanum commersonii]
MGRGRPRKPVQKDRVEEILHGISTSANGGKINTVPWSEIQLSTLEAMVVVVSDLDKEKQVRDEEWPKLTQQRGAGGGIQKYPIEINGTVNLDKNVGGAQRKLNLPDEDKKWAPLVVVCVVGAIPSIGAMERFIVAQGSCSAKPIVLYHSDGCFVVRFANEEERDNVLCAGPHYLLKRHGIVLEQQNWYEWKPLYCQKCLQVGHSCDKPKEIPAKRGQRQGQRKEWRPTIMGDKNQEKQTEPQSDPIHEMETQRSTGKRVALKTTWIENPEQDERSRFESGQHSGANDRPIGSQVHILETRDFQECINDYNLTELTTVGRKFTWTNGHVFSRIDRALVNADWVLHMPLAQVLTMDPLFSDHSPLSINVEKHKDAKKRPFRLYNCLA